MDDATRSNFAAACSGVQRKLTHWRQPVQGGEGVAHGGEVQAGGQAHEMPQCVRHAGRTPCPDLVSASPARYRTTMPTTMEILETSYPEADSLPPTTSTMTARARR